MVVRPVRKSLLSVYQDLRHSPGTGWVKAAQSHLLRLLTPLVILWGFIFQRLNPTTR
jgi:hypothetical protein